MERIEVVTGVQRRRRYSPRKKADLVALCEQPGMSVSLVARRHGISPSLLFRWKKLMNDVGMTAVGSGDEVVSAAEVKALKRQVRELERVLGRKTMETEILKEALEVAQAKKLISRMPLLPPDDSR
ncbi:transposase [Aquisalimonas asiatica]|uniref:Transposase n=1 Tax=Aquisalimonas asiatica TaxID=406100 RepID=A0A1H8QM87_9GAMM|nr:transposase [Aquisalimonas asiatica]